MLQVKTWDKHNDSRFPGSPVVAVRAASPDLLSDAIKMVEMEYEPLPYVFDGEEALTRRFCGRVAILLADRLQRV